MCWKCMQLERDKPALLGVLRELRTAIDELQSETEKLTGADEYDRGYRNGLCGALRIVDRLQRGGGTTDCESNGVTDD